MENYEKNVEDNLVELVAEKERADKVLLTVEVFVGVLSTLVLLVPALLGAFLPLEDWQKIIVSFSGFVPAFIGFFFAVRIEQLAGYYECRACGHRYVPTYKDTSLAMHMGRTRYMKCPKCGEHTWQKKVIKRNK